MQDELADTTKALADKQPAILAALRIKASELDAITADAQLPSDRLNLANLSALYRYAALAKALRMPVQDLITVKKLAGNALNPFTTGNPEPTLEFIRLVQTIKSSGFLAPQLDYLFRHQVVLPSKFPPQQPSVEALLKTLRDGLIAIAKDNELPLVRDSELTRNKLSILFSNEIVDEIIQLIEGTFVYNESLDILTPKINFPESLQRKVRHERNFLSFTGAMTNDEKNLLLTLSSVDAYQTAIEWLYQQPRDLLSRNITALETLPMGITDFPDAVKNKIRYERKVLSFIGVMTDEERDSLLALSPVGSYQAAIQRLYQQSHSSLNQYSMAKESRILANFFSNLDVAKAELMNKSSLDIKGRPILLNREGNQIVDIDNPEQVATAVTTAIAAKFGYLLTNFLPYLQDILSLNLIQQTLSQSLNLDDAILELLLTNPKILQSNLEATEKVLIDFLVLGNLTIDQALPSDTTETYERLYKIAMLVNTFNLTEAEVEYWFSSDFVGFQLNMLSIAAIEQPTLFEEWKQLSTYISLRNSLPQGVSSLIDVFKADDVVKPDRLANLTGWRKIDVEQARAAFGFQNADLKNVFDLVKIQQVVALSQQIGVSVEKLKSWTEQPLDPIEAVAQAKAIKNAAKAKYTEEAWLEVSKPLSDKLREQQKSALISYVLSMPDIRRANVTDSNRLFEYFLIDVEMCACMNSSRIKQAISSVQLFVQRCLLNLEPRVKPSGIDSDRWQWTKNYRVWEANRKVFLYPENWIEPELRDDKSPFFKELESELLQTDVTNEAAEKALLNYLYKLDQVARLEVCGMYLQEETDGKHKSILHVFARTMGGAVRSYYYRRLLDNREWTPWEKVELDINGVQGSDQTQQDGIHLLPVVWNRRLYLFWLVFTQKAETLPEQSSPVNPNNGIAIKFPKKYWEIQLAWSKYEQGKWMSKRISQQPVGNTKSIIDKTSSFSTYPSKYRLKALLKNQEGLEIHLLWNDPVERGNNDPSLSRTPEKSISSLILFKENQDIALIPSPEKTEFDLNQKEPFHFMGYKKETVLTLDIPKSSVFLNKEISVENVPVLETIPSARILPLNQYYRSPSTSPYFYQDGQHVYFVRSREGYETIVKQVANPQKTSPFPRKELAPSFQGRLPVPKVDGRLKKSVANPWVLAEQQLVVQNSQPLQRDRVQLSARN